MTFFENIARIKGALLCLLFFAAFAQAQAPEACDGYCVWSNWPTFECWRISTDPTGEFSNGQPILTCAEAEQNCRYYGEYYLENGCPGGEGPLTGPIFTTTDLPEVKVGASYWSYYNNVAQFFVNGERQWGGSSSCEVESGDFPSLFRLQSDCGMGMYFGAMDPDPPRFDKAESYSFTLKATIGGVSATRSFTINVVMPQAPVITGNFPLQDGEAGVNYNEWFEAGDYATWEIINGSLPPGLQLYSNGRIEGNPSAAGTYTFTVEARNVAGSDTKVLSITITAEQYAPEIGYYNVPLQCIVGEWCNMYFYSDRGANWSVSGDLPADFEWSYSDYTDYNYLDGKFKTAGAYAFKVKAENSKGYDEKSFTINVVMPQKPVITTTSLINGVRNEWYSKYLEATERAEWSVVNGSLPPGLWIDSYYGGIEGEPSATGTFTFTVKAENAAGSDTKEFSIKINDVAQMPAITTNLLPEGVRNEWYGKYLEATERAEWSIVDGSLPPGLWIDSYYGGIEGEPSATGTFTFTVKAENAAGSDTKVLSITIYSQPKFITYWELPDGYWGEQYSKQIEATENPSSWSIVSGSLPSGLKIDEKSGLISGKPTEANDDFCFTVKASNAAGSVEEEFCIYINNVPPLITTLATLPSGEVGATYSKRIEANGSGIKWSITGDLPSGLVFSEENGTISGVPAAGSVGDYSFTIETWNSEGFGSRNFTIKIEAMRPPSITTATLANGTVGKAYSARLAASNAVSSWEVASGSLPNGLSLSSSSSTISGTPTKKGTYKFTVKATNAAGSSTKELTIVIDEPPAANDDDDDKSPILPHIAKAGGGIHAYAIGNRTIMLENLPSSAKVEVYNLQGKRVYSSQLSTLTPQLAIKVQAQGMYIVKVNKSALRVSVM